MPGKIDESQVKYVAKLSRLELTDEEVKKFSTQLSAIVEYIEKLNELDTENVEPLAHCLPINNILRDDVVKESLTADQALANAPDRVDDYFKVPKVLDDGGAT